MGDIELIRDGEASIAFDTRHLPIVIATWFGEPTEALVDGYFDVHERMLRGLEAKGQHFILVTDSFATERPSAKVRRRIVDRMQRIERLATERTLQSYVIISNALIRGVMIALAWIDPKLQGSENVKTPAEAIERAFARLDAEGIRRPPDLSARSYQRPARADA